MGYKIYDFDDFLNYAENKGFDFNDICDFKEHFENLNTNRKNLNKLREFLKW